MSVDKKRNTSVLAPATPGCIIHLANKQNGEPRTDGVGYLLDAVREIEDRLVELECTNFVVTVDGKNGTATVIFETGNCRNGVSTFTKEFVARWAWDVEKFFDYLVSCSATLTGTEKEV